MYACPRFTQKKRRSKRYEKGCKIRPVTPAFSLWAWLIFITCCGNSFLYAESSKLDKLSSEILNDLQLIVRSYKYLKFATHH